MKIINVASELKGRLIAYFGGTGISVSSAKAQAAIEQANNVVDILHWTIMPGVSLGSALTILGAAIVISRFGFDVWTYFDKRKLLTKRGL